MNQSKKSLVLTGVGAAGGAALGLLIARWKPAATLHSFHQMSPALLMSVAILCVFSIYWSAAAKHSKPAQSSESKASRQFHLFLINAGVLLLIFPVPRLTRRFLPAGHVYEVIGLLIEAAFFLLAVWARRTLGSNWSGEVRIATGHQLVRSGPYKYIRHPIYTAILGMYCGIMIVSGQIHAPIAVVLITLAYLRKIRMEETALAAAFGDEFTAWRRESWRLVPPVF
jgi:protein-S-isoprenylcysteine O-methyltransferase Ste14